MVIFSFFLYASLLHFSRFQICWNEDLALEFGCPISRVGFEFLAHQCIRAEVNEKASSRSHFFAAFAPSRNSSQAGFIHPFC